MDLALFVLRIVVGGLFAAHGAQKLFGSFGGHGLAGTGQFFEQLGLKPGERHARFAGWAEFGGGLLLVVGFLTPLGAAAFALAAAGPGAWSLDSAFGLSWGAGWGFVALAAGILSGVGTLIKAR